MATQINVKLDDDLLGLARQFQKARGYLSLQELMRDALRDKIYDSLEIRPEYAKKLLSKEATTFLSVEESEKTFQQMKRRAELEKKKNKPNFRQKVQKT